ncbi:hypothetical protein Aduo_017941 [Ancylostoma duodenale]
MIILSVLALLSYATVADAQYSSRFDFDNFNPFPSGFGIFPSTWNPFPNGFPFPRFPTFPDFSNFFGSDWWKKVDEHITEAIEKTKGGSGIRHVNDTLEITQEIGGKTYTAEFPGNSSYSLSTSKQTINGKTVSTVKLTVNGETSVYETKDGKTTVTDGSGKPLPDGGFFKVVNTEEPQITKAPAPTDSPEEPPKASTSAPTVEEETKTTSEDVETPEPSQKPGVDDNAPTTTVAPAVEIKPSTTMAPEEKEGQESNSITDRTPTRGERK